MENQIPPTPALQQISTRAANSPKGLSLKSVFIGLNGVRSGWRVLLFYSLLASVISLLVVTIRAVRALLNLPHHATNLLTPGRGLLNEGVFLFGVLFTSAIFARFERRSFADYGLPLRGAFGARFLEGLLWGFTLMAGMLLVLRATGHFHFGSLGITPEEIPAFALLWAGFFVMVGLAEGFAFSGYPLSVLTRGLGFWPAAALLAFLFGGLHLAVNAGENWLGSVNLVIVGFLVAFTLQRTGNLWFAIGMHAAWDWAQSFLFGVADSGVTIVGHLLNPSFKGSKWVTGGTAGPEGSVVTLLGYVLVFALINFRFPEARNKGQFERADGSGRVDV
jgi:CAAX protease family protein